MLCVFNNYYYKSNNYMKDNIKLYMAIKKKQSSSKNGILTNQIFVKLYPYDQKNDKKY